MARPRVFVSSTYYDLKHVRGDVDRFIKEQGYESILNEKGNIPYGSEKKLEEYCYKEIELCDILVSVVGGRFGTPSQDGNYSISNVELKTAIDKGKQVYIFVDKSVLSEHKTYTRNKDKSDVVYAAVDDVRIYHFLDEIFSLPLNNQVQPFETVYEITSHLKEQWAGLFQRLLSEGGRQKEVNLIESLRATSKTLNQTVQYLVDEKTKGDQAIKEILLSNHPAFENVRQKLNLSFRVFFQSKAELSQLMKASSYEEVDYPKIGFVSWKNFLSSEYLHIAAEVFDKDGRLKPYTPYEWNENWIQKEDDDIPF
jgi:hypothetical protein